jgi:nicotinamide-nucleotide amidase
MDKLTADASDSPQEAGMLKTSLRWLKNSPPFELEFVGSNESGISTMTGASSDPSVPRRYHSPKELVAIGIAGCTGVDIVSILAKMRQPLSELEIEADLTQTTEHPRVFEKCFLTYRFSGEQLQLDRVLRAVGLSYVKYCGVSAMIKRSGCEFHPKVIVNEIDVTSQFNNVIEEIAGQSESSVKRAVSAGILVSGNELLGGKTADTNGLFLVKRLTQLGFRVHEILFLGDSRSALMGALKRMCGQYDFIVMTGGLGPTQDDLTREIVANVFDLPLEFSEPAWEVCRKAFQSMGREEIPESNRKQGFLPRGATVLANKFGTAAGFQVSGFFESSKCTLFALPGVPWECEEMFTSQVAPQLPQASEHTYVWGPWHLWGLGESALQSQLIEWETSLQMKVPDVAFSYQAHAGYISYGFSSSMLAVSANEKSANDVISVETESLLPIFGDKLLYMGPKKLLEHLHANLIQLNLRIAAAESCTGGRIAAEMTTIPGISAVFNGAVVAYSNASKTSLLNVSPSTLTKHGAVSQETAIQMALGVARQFTSEIGFSVTGIAGPEGGSDTKPIGTVCFALAIHRSCLGDISANALMQKLIQQQWKLVSSTDSQDFILLSVEKNFSSFLSREIIQKRAAAFVQCSLVALTESLILNEKNPICPV